jgi:thiamine biosynthesis lipoprotein
LHFDSDVTGAHMGLLSLTRMRPLLGTLVEIRAVGDEGCVSRGIDTAFAAVERVQHLMSFHDPCSDVSRINAAATGCDVAVASETYQVLRTAQTLGRQSGGAFDITIAPHLVREGFLPGPAACPEENGTDAAARFSDLEMRSARTVRWRKKGWIDLGGIAKGHAVDRAVSVLQAQGIVRGLVNAGGDLRCFGGAWPIQLRIPDSPGALLEVGSLRDGAIATSAGYFNDAPGASRGIDQLVDPATGECVAWNASFSVVASSCTVADALTKVVRLTGTRFAFLLDHYHAQALILSELGLRSCGSERLRRAAPVRGFSSERLDTPCA